MMESNVPVGIRLLEMGVVVTAKELDPQMFSSHTLVALGVVPETWGVASEFATTVLSGVAFENQVRLTVGESQVLIGQFCESALRDTYECHAVTAAFVGKFSNLPYVHLGLNCVLAKEQPEPGRWLVERFGAESVINDERLTSIQPAFAYPLGDATCNIGLDPGMVGDRPCILARCNLHHEGPLSADRLQSAIASWGDRQERVADMAAKLLGVEPT